jgi:signal transduction histidine kinase
MRERVRQLKGEFSLQSGKGGTTMTALLPAPGCPGDSGTREERAS